jgi:hypothetical protein
VKLARLTRGKESSSWRTPTEAETHNQDYSSQTYLQNQVQPNWPTANARDWKDSGPTQGNRQNPNLGTAVVKDVANWPTPRTNDDAAGRPNDGIARVGPSGQRYGINLSDKVLHGQAAPVSSSSLGSRQELSWPTARSLDGQINESLESWTARRDRKQAEGINLHRPLPIAVMQEQFPTPRTCDWKSSPNADSNIKRMEVGQATLAEFVHAKHKKGDLWSTPRTGATESSRPNNKGGIPLADQAKREHRNWATPQAHDAQGPKTPEQIAVMRAKGHGVKNLNEQACWGTPTARDHKSGRGNNEREYKELTPMVERQQSGKLNPRWVETLMGLPIGWTMPSCTYPQTIAPMSCDSLAMESACPPLSGLGEFSLAS